MQSIRQLDTNTKLYACFAILLLSGAALAIWLLTHLGQSAEAASLRAWTWSLLALELGAAVALARALAAEIAGPAQQAVDLARRIASGNMGARGAPLVQGAPGLLMRSMQEMNDKLIDMIGEVRAGTETIASGASQIASGSLDLSARTEQQAAALEETASSMEQLTATVKQNADHANQASRLAISASQVAVKGGEVVSEVVGTMASINDSSKRIAEIIGVIDGIAFQTNILALNAAVEAARAGEQGRGFAVVASEVRNLAQRSAAAAKEIKALIDDSVDKVTAGTLLADKAGSTMHDVVTSVKRVTDIIAEIADASAEQTTGIEQVNQAIAAMDQAVQQNAALVEQSSAAAASMREQAAGLSRTVGNFVAGSGQSRPAPQIHLIASNPDKPGAARARRASAPARPGAAHKPAPPPPAAKRGAVSQDVDWEEF